ncbi:hypothetical protein [Scytonema sp. NUACC21]
MISEYKAQQSCERVQGPLPQSTLLKHLNEATTHFNTPHKELQPLS